MSFLEESDCPFKQYSHQKSRVCLFVVVCLFFHPSLNLAAHFMIILKICNIWATSWENLFMSYANNKGADQRSLISAFVVRCLYSIIPLVSIPEISSIYLPSVAVQVGFSLPCSQTPKTGFLVTRLNYMVWLLQLIWIYEIILQNAF